MYIVLALTHSIASFALVHQCEDNFAHSNAASNKLFKSFEAAAARATHPSPFFLAAAAPSVCFKMAMLFTTARVNNTLLDWC